MQVRIRSSGRAVTFDPSLRLGKGGEGVVYEVPHQPSLVAKIYHPSLVTPERGRKLEVMLNNPPVDPMRAKGLASIAWPTEILEYSHTGQIVGFIMPRVVYGMKPVFEYYDPKSRIRNSPFFSYDHLVRTGLNLVSAVRALHTKKYVIGDVNESNVMVSDNALVTLVDTDSFQVTDPQSGITYRCPVGKEDFTPPELQGKHFSQIDRHQEHDLFGLGVLLYHLLMENSQPFGGVYTGAGDPPDYGDRIAKGYFLYCQKRKVPFRPGPLSPSFDHLHPDLQRLFLQCFEDGHAHPGSRPDANNWYQALRTAEKALNSCSVNKQHWYGSHLQTCPWCMRAQRLKIDAFPSRSQAKSTAAAFAARNNGSAARRPTAFGHRAPVFTPRPAPPTVNALYASCAYLTLGQSCTLFWDVSNAQSINLNQGIGGVPSAGNIVVAPARNTTYKITARGTGGVVTRTVSIKVTKPSPIISFSASSQTITVCQPVILQWNVAQTHTAHLNNNIGAVPNTGQLTVAPFKSTSYILTARGSRWPIRQRIQVNVALPQIPVPLNAYLPVNDISSFLPNHLSLLIIPAVLQHFVTLAQIIKLRLFNHLHLVTVELNNYVPMLQARVVASGHSASPRSFRSRFFRSLLRLFGFSRMT